MASFLSYLPSIIGAVSAVAGLFSADLQGLVAAHPTLALVLGGIYSIFSHLMPSPVAPSK